MFLFDWRKLASDLATRRVTEFDSLKYYAAGAAIMLVTQQMAVFGGAPETTLFALDCVIAAFSTGAGILYCWQRNGGDAGSDFVLRMVCLSVPVGVRMTLLWIAAYAALTGSANIFNSGFFSNPYRAQVLFSYAAYIGILVYFWNLMGQAMRLSATSEIARQ